MRLVPSLTFLLHDNSKTYLQLLALLPLVFFQFSVTTLLLPSYVVCNLITVWVVFNAVLLRLPKALTLALLLALLLETHGAAPRGLYLCAYGTLVVVLHLFRGLIAWNMLSAWLTVIVSSELWVLVLEHISLAMPPTALLAHSQQYLLRLGVTCLAGYVLLKYTHTLTRRIH